MSPQPNRALGSRHAAGTTGLEAIMSDYVSYDEIRPSHRFEAGRIFDISDCKWGHPALQDTWMGTPGFAAAWNLALSEEERKEIGSQSLAAVDAMTAGMPMSNYCDVIEYIAPGCVEEPEASVKVLVYRPKGLTKKKARVLFHIMGGGLVAYSTTFAPIDQIAQDHQCVVVVPFYRLSWQGKYPAAINDCHAAYQWMIDNADKLQINADNVVIEGMSSGAHLGLSLGFRLKRYGICPKGIVAIQPQTDERENGRVSDQVHGAAGGFASDNHDFLWCYLGTDFGSSRIGPEAIANHATVTECVGYPPAFIHTVELDSDRDKSREFYGKLLEAKTYAEYHCWAGAWHSSMQFAGSGAFGDVNEYSERTKHIFDANIEDCFTYDLRRPWVVEELKENGPWW